MRNGRPVARFCASQLMCVFDDGLDWACGAHLNEGRCLRCQKESPEDARGVPGRCEDFEAFDEVTAKPREMIVQQPPQVRADGRQDQLHESKYDLDRLAKESAALRTELHLDT